MSFRPHTNLAFSLVATAPSPAASGTSLVVGAGEGVRFPNPASTGNYYCTVGPAGVDLHAGNSEIVLVTARSTDTFTITRAQLGTSARTVIVGDRFFIGLVGADLTDIESSVKDGWVPAGETWTYASASTITVPSGAASKYAVGDRIKWTQTTVRYGVLTAVADTLLTIAVNTDYVVANAAISANFYSHETSPVGYPQWFNYAPTWGGFSVNPSGITAKFAVTGRTCFVALNTATGTSNATTFTVSAPIAFGFGTDHAIGSFTFAEDNGAGVTSPGRIQLTGSSLAIFKDMYTGTWTASGAKRAFFQLAYQI